jgi:hypothetical protein
MNEGKDFAVEGEPVAYHTMPAEGQVQESFDSKGIHIHYSDFSGGFGNHNPASKGG